MPAESKNNSKTGKPEKALAESLNGAVASLIEFNKGYFNERKIKKISEVVESLNDASSVSWINVDGLQNIALIEEIGKQFGLHPLTLSDIVETKNRPKVEDAETYIYIALKLIHYETAKDRLGTEQVSIILGKNFLVSFHETKASIFDKIKERLKKGNCRVRELGADYLAYELIDAIVDDYFKILEKFSEKIEGLESRLVKSPTKAMLGQIHTLKKQVLFLKRSVWPLREAISQFERGNSSLIKKGTLIYMRDVYGHIIQAIDTVETYRDMLAGMLDIYLSSLSNKMNEIMKVLTIISTIFIPLTFITGVYGMNFVFMPELRMRFSYLFVWISFFAIAALMIFYFRRKQWI